MIDRWMLLLLAVLLTACHGSDEDDSSSEDCYLDIHVYAPDRPIVTRGDVGEVPPSDAEKTVHSLQIWAFKNKDGARVGYLDVDPASEAYADPTYLNQLGQQTYRMKVSRDFADHPEAVDVYVVANAESCGFTEDHKFNENTTRSALDNAQIDKNYFGTSERVSTVGNKGLPMSAVEKNQPIYGSFPSLRIGKENEMTTLKLTRAVSKLRFVLCRKDDDNSTKKLVKINSIKLNENQIPDNTWLIAREASDYSQRTHSAIDYGGVEKSVIPSVDDPLIYAYETQTAKEYEDLINDAVSKGHLWPLGLTYLRESDLQLKGNINYTYTDGNTDKTVDTEFSMAAPGDFLRNHSWIIYIFYMDTKIHVQMVTDIGMRSWIPDGRDESVIVYNW